MQKRMNRDYLVLRTRELKAAGITHGAPEYVGKWDDGRGGHVELRIELLELDREGGRIRVVGEGVREEIELEGLAVARSGLKYYMVCAGCQRQRLYLVLRRFGEGFCCRKCFGVQYACRTLRHHPGFDGVVRPLRILNRFTKRFSEARSRRIRWLILIESLRAEHRLSRAYCRMS